MDRFLRESRLTGMFAHAPALLNVRMPPKWQPVDSKEVIWWIFAATVSIALLPNFVGEPTGGLKYVVAIGGSAGCGWAWLLSRTLFRAEKPIPNWTLLAVAGIIVVESWWHLASHSSAGGVEGEVRRMITNAASFICVGALMLVFVEALSGYASTLPRAERRFRQIFCLSFAAMLVIALIWAAGAEEMSFGAEWVETVVAISGLLLVAGARFAISFRRKHPLARPASRKVPQAVSDAARNKELAARIISTLDQDDLFRTPDLKVADLAALIKEQDYKVTSCITGVMGYRNFNHLVNERRVEQAKIMLTDPQNGLPILSIALDCGFNSIGPFNRAFKEHTGMTPGAFRAEVAVGGRATGSQSQN